MYATLAIKTNSKNSGRIIGTHQRIDEIAYKLIKKQIPPECQFPTIKQILNFEGMGGPDGLKRKSPGKDEPMHFIIPDHDDGKLIKMLEDHQYNIRQALKNKNLERAAFELAWMAHAIADGLTPAHHFPLVETQKQLMSEHEFVKVFGVPIKGIMHGRNARETLKNNWIYWGSNGHMSKHIAFEYGIAITLTALRKKQVTPIISSQDFKTADLHEIFYTALKRVAKLDMYTRFCEKGWTTNIALEIKKVLLPEVIRAITLCWYSSLPQNWVKKS